jgi:thioredoxin-related protein
MFSLVGYKSPEHFENIISFVENRKPNEKFRDYLKRKTINVVEKSDYKLKDDPLFLPATTLSERQQLEHQQSAPQKPLLVLFEANNCLECENFHNDVLALPEIREQLEKFDVVRLDTNDSITSLTSPSGETFTPQQWFTSQELTQLPTLLFYSTGNQLILKTDSIVKRQRMLNSMGLILEKAYEKGWNYQRYARSKGIERAMKKQNNQ